MTASSPQTLDRSEPVVVTLGCRLNAFESQVMRDLAVSAGARDTVIVNTCAVTAEAERQARQAIRRSRRRHPNARIIVTGCAAQIAPARYADMPEVDLVLGNADKLRAASFSPRSTPRVQVSNFDQVEALAPHLIQGFNGRARAFVQIQTGCDHRCTFCIIPFGRGPSRSVPLGVVAAQCRRLVEAGFKELVLTGVDLTSYGADLPGRPSLGQLVRRLLRAVPDLPRLRLSSIDPAEVDSDLFAAVAEEPRLMPHLHLSVQAGHDLILKRMRRRHTRQTVLDLVRKIRRHRPGLVFGADLIAGFPTETEDMARSTLDLITECDLTYLHVFPYSPRAGTPAARMPQIPVEIRRKRAARWRAAGEARLHQFLQSQVGSRCQVLLETPSRGRTEHFAPVELSDPAAAGTIVSAMIGDASATTLRCDAAIPAAA